MRNADQYENLERFNRPANDNADAVRQNLDKGHYTSAEQAFLDNQGVYTDAQLEEFNRSADVQLRKNSPEELPEGEISEERAESAIQAVGDVEILRYGEDHKPGVQEITEGVAICAQNEVILSEVEDLIAQASKEGTKGKVGKWISIPLSPLIGGIYSILMGDSIRKKLAQLEGNIGKLKNIDGRLKEMIKDETLAADKISPDKGHIEHIIGTAAAGTGVQTLVVTAALTGKTSIAALAAASPIGVGLLVGGAALGIAGLYKIIKSYKNITATQESLDKFRKAVSEAKVENSIQHEHFQNYTNTYTQGARENIVTNFPGTLAA